MNYKITIERKEPNPNFELAPEKLPKAPESEPDQLKEAYAQGWNDGQIALKEMLDEEQKKFTQGFAYRGADRPINFERE